MIFIKKSNKLVTSEEMKASRCFDIKCCPSNSKECDKIEDWNSVTEEKSEIEIHPNKLKLLEKRLSTLISYKI